MINNGRIFSLLISAFSRSLLIIRRIIPAVRERLPIIKKGGMDSTE
jgi:hypothetical protein